MGTAICPGTNQLHIELLFQQSRSFEYVLVAEENLRSIFHLCEGQQKCKFPVLKDAEEGAPSLAFFCSQVTEPCESF